MSLSYKQKYFDLLERHNALLERVCGGEVSGEVAGEDDKPAVRHSGSSVYPLSGGYWVVTATGEARDWTEGETS